MTTGTAIRTNTEAAKRQSEVVHDNENLSRLDFVELRDGKNRMTAAIHEAGGFKQNRLAAFGRERVPLCRSLPSRSKLVGELIDDEKPDIMTRLFILGSGVSQTSD